MSNDIDTFLAADSPDAYAVQTRGPGPAGTLPLTPDFLRDAPCGHVFGWTLDAGMGWPAEQLGRDEFLLLATTGGLRDANGKPLALGYHVGHWEMADLARTAAEELRASGAIPFAAFLTDPCDGRSQGTVGMMDSLPFRNDAAMVLGRLIRSLPTRRGVLGLATCDKALPAMMMALAGCGDLPTVLAPGGVTLPPAEGEDLGTVQSIGARFARGELSLAGAACLGCRACGSAGGGCQFLGTAATSQVVAEALGLAVLHGALAPSGQAIWHDVARRSARALRHQAAEGITTRRVLTEKAVHNAMTVHAAFGGSTNLLLHLPAVAFSAGLPRPTVEDWDRVNRATPRLVDVLPNGPVGHPTVRVYLAGGVPEVMLHLRELGLLRLDTLTAHGRPLGEMLDLWAPSDRRKRLRERLQEADGIDPDTVIFPPARAREAGLLGTMTFPRGNLAPEGSVVKSTAIDPSRLDAQGVFRHVGPARVFCRESAAIAAVKGQAERPIEPGDVIVLIGRGPLGCGMEETFQITGALKHLSRGREVSLITDARFSGVSTGACIGHIGPEALAGGPLGKVRDGDRVRIEIDCVKLHGRVDMIGEAGGPELTPDQAVDLLAARPPHPDLKPDENLPAATRLWAALQQAGGGTWGGCVYDVDRIVDLLGAGGASARGT